MKHQYLNTDKEEKWDRKNLNILTQMIQKK